MSPSISISTPANIIGNFTCEEPVKIWHRGSFINCSIGAFTSISPNCSLFEIDIGRYCSIGNSVEILSSHPIEKLTTSALIYQEIFSHPFNYKPKFNNTNLKKTKIENDVWIGSHVLIKPGITIGNGSIIGAGSVVTRDVQPYSIVGGTPARHIRNRFPDEKIELIESLEWWEYDIAKMDLDWNDLDLTIDTFKVLIHTNQAQPYKSKKFKIWSDSNNSFKFETKL